MTIIQEVSSSQLVVMLEVSFLEFREIKAYAKRKTDWPRGLLLTLTIRSGASTILPLRIARVPIMEEKCTLSSRSRKSILEIMNTVSKVLAVTFLIKNIHNHVVTVKVLYN